LQLYVTVSVVDPTPHTDPPCAALASHVLHAPQVIPFPKYPALHWHTRFDVELHSDLVLPLTLHTWHAEQASPVP